MAEYMESGDKCLSTHGGSGYAPNSYWDGDAIICGVCGTRIENPQPTGQHFVGEGGWNLSGRNIGHWEPTWPEWLGGTRGVKAGKDGE